MDMQADTVHLPHLFDKLARTPADVHRAALQAAAADSRARVEPSSAQPMVFVGWARVGNFQFDSLRYDSAKWSLWRC